MLGTVLLVLLILLLLGALPTWPHSRSWGYAPSGGIGLIVVIIIILLLLKRILKASVVSVAHRMGGDFLVGCSWLPKCF